MNTIHRKENTEPEILNEMHPLALGAERVNLTTEKGEWRVPHTSYIRQINTSTTTTNGETAEDRDMPQLCQTDVGIYRPGYSREPHVEVTGNRMPGLCGCRCISNFQRAVQRRMAMSLPAALPARFAAWDTSAVMVGDVLGWHYKPQVWLSLGTRDQARLG